MKLSRLWQPRKLLFWQMILFNVLSSVCSYAMRALPLNTGALLVVALVALLNVGFGLLAAWMLVRDEPAAAAAGPGPKADQGPRSNTSTSAS